MNPFELPGPQFLLFFVFLGGALTAGLAFLRRTWEPAADVPVQLTDPYQIACLRGGPAEVLKLATTGLIDRGLLEISGNTLRVSQPELARLVTNPVERGILDHFATGSGVNSMMSNSSLVRAAKNLEPPLEERGLILDTDGRLQNFFAAAATIAVLWITAGTKIGMAMERHHPFGFLILVGVLFSIAAVVIAFARKTRRCYRYLRDMQNLFEPLRRRSGAFVPHGNTNEALLLAAVFGIAALPSVTYPYAQIVAAANSGNSGGSSCGSSSSSCGGGGGCGGCGGCGS